jgi:two-component system LytT family response regulator
MPRPARHRFGTVRHKTHPIAPGMDGTGCLRQTSRMTSANSTTQWARPLTWQLQCLFGFVYWLVFLVILEPGNLVRASEAGVYLGVAHEALRMLGAASIGAMTTPALLSLSERFPPFGRNRLRNLLIQGLSVSGFALGLIAISCVLAAWAFSGTWLPTTDEVRWQLADNWSLLVYALAAEAAIASLLGNRRKVSDASDPPPAPTPTTGPLSHVMTKARGRHILITLSQVDWIESQGNYLALHVGDAAHLIRHTLATFEAQLDPENFVRVHRRALVSIDRIQDLKPLTNGDAELRLRSGQLVRVSRRYRKQLERMRQKSES